LNPALFCLINPAEGEADPALDQIRGTISQDFFLVIGFKNQIILTIQALIVKNVDHLDVKCNLKVNVTSQISLTLLLQ
jgi:hypothetical protein